MSVIREIAEVEQKVKSCQNRIQEIDKKLRTQEIAEENKKRFEEERSKLQETEQLQERRLATLRAENRKTMLVAVAVAVLAYLVFSFVWQVSESA
ncbi:uncharacterized protein LOC134179371 [Corticium candelabrum]|uniref:uncharacterized protein LOC134179371 n=1 Tax=Corticium candelabrum TaxID=121492 RepID=UPI002E260CAE|nr:uncharacterized protein LOC134179371 [Corticium candelabrum]